MGQRDDAWALWASLGNNLTTAEYDTLSFLVRGNLAPSQLAQLDAALVPPGLGRDTVLLELQAIEGFPPNDAAAALAVWIAVAEQQYGQRFATEFADRRTALSAPGRDPAAARGGAERAKVDMRDDLVGIGWLDDGHKVSKSVGFLTVPRYYAGARNKDVVGTGFIVSTDRQHLMTAYHVVARDPDEGAPSKADLDRQLNELTVSFDFLIAGNPGNPLAGGTLVAFDRDLDYAIIRLSAPIASDPLPLYTGDMQAIDEGLAVVANIIQHPMRKGIPQPKQLGLRNNAIWNHDKEKLYYFTDTRAGSSGAPVLSDGWQVYAVHTGWDSVKPISYMGRNFAFSNRGTLMSKIVDHAKAQLPSSVKLHIG